MEAFYAYVKATIIQAHWFYVYRHGRPFSRRLVAVHKCWCIGSGLNIVYFFMLSSRSVRALKLPLGRRRHSSAAVPCSGWFSSAWPSSSS